jgi:hypothetical protein
MNDEQPLVFAETMMYACREYLLSDFLLSSAISNSSDHSEDNSTLCLSITSMFM